MRYGYTGDFSLLTWLFSIQGILSIIIIGGIIYMIYRYLQNRNNDTDNHFPPRRELENDNRFSSETADEKSFWDDFNKNEDFPQRVEEPIPTNAIAPTTAPVYSEEMATGQMVSALDEKDCTKDLNESVELHNTVPAYQNLENLNINKDEKGE